jgi:ABC-type nitrate/sulfonate/bicarbonate transport system substrate-binding protein
MLYVNRSFYSLLRNRRIFIALTFCFLIFIAPVSAQTKKIILCEPARTVNLIAPLVAQKEGIFQKEGLEVDVVQALSSVCIAGLVSKSIDYTTTFGSDVMSASLKGLPVRGVMAMHTGSDYGFLARKDIADFKDLAGKTVGVSRVGSGADTVARFLLERHGLTPGSTVKISPLGSMEARVTALQQGLIDAAIISMPEAFDLERKGARALAWGPNVPDLPFLNGLTTTVAKIETRPDEVRAMIRSILKANKFIHENKEKTVELLKEWMKISQDLAEKSYDVTLPGFTLTGEPRLSVLKILLDEAKKNSGVKQDVPLSKVFEASALKAAQKDLRSGG